MDTSIDAANAAVSPLEPLERLSSLYLLRLFHEAAKTQRPLRHMLKERAALALLLDQEESALTRRKASTLRELISAQLTDRAMDADSLDSALARTVTRFGANFGLNPDECRILLFAVVAGSHGALDDAVPSSSSAAGRDLDHLTAVATGLDLPTVRHLLAPQGLLIRSGLVRRYDRGYLDLSERLELLDGMAKAFVGSADAEAFERCWLARVPGSTFELKDVAHLSTEVETAIAVIKGALAQQRRGVQILLYGEPGVGKTQLARLIAHQAGAQPHLLPDAREDGGAMNADQRLRRYAFLQRLLAHRPGAMLILDEVEEMLASTDQWGWASQAGVPPSSAQKAWKNRLLEESAIPGIWIANWIHAIDPALLRRFTLAIRVPVPPARVRVAMLAQRAQAYADDGRVRALISRRDDISPADIERAHVAAELAAGHSERDASTRFLQALAMRADGRREPILANRRPAPQLPYRLGWLNTDPALDQLLPLLEAAGAARMCFSGAPGTGKTALASHLAEQLTRPLHVKKGSDLLSCWVGETEKNIAEAFAAARREDALLLIDEADSFLRNRESAQRGFEVSAVNQLLKELEDFDGLVALCTNFFDMLDAAVLRRVDLKVGFSRLQACAAREAFIEAAGVLRIDAADAEAVLRQQPLRADEYALGDIAVALRQTRLRSANPDAMLLRNCLEAERSARDRHQGRAIGFTA